MRVLILAFAAFTVPLSALGLNPVVWKLQEPGSLPGNSAFGDAVAQSPDYLLVSEPDDFLFGTYSGAVHQFDARTGRYLRQLLPDSVPQASFGASITIGGNIIAVGAPIENVVADHSGAVYLFDARTGRRLHKLRASDGADDDRFGSSVSLSGDWLLVGATGGADDRGAVYLFNARTGEELQRMTASDGIAFDRFGSDVALMGEIALVGAYGDDGNKGSAYLFHARTASQIAKLTGADGDANDRFGRSVALAQGLAAIGAPGHNSSQGAVYLFDLVSATFRDTIVPVGAPLVGSFGQAVALNSGLLGVGNYKSVGLYHASTGDWLKTIVPNDNESGDNFGGSVSLCGNRLLAGANDDNEVSSGSAYVFSPITSPLSLTPVAKTGDFAPGAIDISFRNFTSAFVNPAGAVAFGAGLTGLQSNRGRDTGIWGTFSGFTNVAPLSLSARSRDMVSTVSGMHSIGKLKAPICNQTISTFYEATITGTGVTRANNRVIFRDDDSIPFGVFRTGTPVAGLGGAAISSFSELVQPHTTGGNLALAFQLQRGVAGILADTDSGLLRASFTGTFQNAFREGALIPGGGGAEFGQFYGRVSHGGTDDVVFPAFVTDAGVPFPRLFRDASAVLSAGDTIPGEGGAQVGGFLAEVSTQPFGPAVSRISLRGTGVTRRNNEMIHSQAFGKVARKGDPVPGEPAGVVWAAFLGFWPVDVDRVVFLAKLAGPGVGRANDCALYLWQEDLSHLKLLREGDAVGAGDGPRVGGISRVDVNPVSGDYVALTTLTGNRTRNLALFTGDADAGNATTQKALRLPHLQLRKGTLYNSGIGTVTGIRSFILSPATDRGGAGGKGLGQVINGSGQIAVTLQFDNRAVELMTGRP
jgi:outer membrane protein assembly factor BamB